MQNGDLGTIAIVGGSCSGVLTILSLLRNELCPEKILVFDPSPDIGKGVAYSTTFSGHLLNVPAFRMGAYADTPTHFFEWCRSRGIETSEGTFLPRMTYGEYLADIFERESSKNSHRCAVEHHRYAVTSVRRSDGGFEVQSSGATFQVDSVVLALGTPASVLPRTCNDSTLIELGLVVEDPWVTPPTYPEGSASNLLLIGSGLTSIDLALSARNAGFKGRITVLSRHGLVPAVHEVAPPLDTTASKFVGTSPVAILSALRELSVHSPWRSVVDSLRPVTSQIWRAWSPRERRSFMRHGRAYWEVHRHRMAPSIAAQVKEMRDGGALDVVAGCIEGLERRESKIVARIRPRGEEHVQLFEFDKVINCTGFGPFSAQSYHGLLGELASQGLVTLRDDGLGLSVPSGTPRTDVPGLYALGSVLRGELFESTAVPELRQQAAQIAQMIAQEGRGAKSALSTPAPCPA